jgi:hypothetical protein
MAAEVLAWIEEVLGEPLPKGPFEDVLKDGIILCKLINKIAPDSVKKIQQKGTNFQLMENIQRYRKQFLYFFLYLGLTMLTCFFVKKSWSLRSLRKVVQHYCGFLQLQTLVGQLLGK